MRSTRILFLLIITPCYLIFTEANINSLEGTVYKSPNHRPSRDVSAVSQTDQRISIDEARSIRDTSEFTLTKEDDLKDLSTDELKKKLDEAEQHMNDTAAKQTRIEGELEIARKASETANSTLEKADGDWKAALAEKDKLEEPLRVLKSDVKNKEEILKRMKELLASSERKVDIPRTAQDKKAYALNASASAERTLLVLRSRISQLDEEEIPRLGKVKENVEANRTGINSRLQAYLSKLKFEGCPNPIFAEKSKAVNERRKREETCSEILKKAEAEQAEMTKTEKPLADAEAALEEANKELREKSKAVIGLPQEIENWKNYTIALENKDNAEAAFIEAREKIVETKEHNAAITKEIDSSKALTAAKEAASRLAAEYTRLEAELAAAKTEVSEAVEILNHYKSKYDDQTTPTPVVTAGPPWLFIGIGVAAGAVLIGVGVLLYCCWWRKRKGGKEEELVVVEEDPCLVLADKNLIPDEKLFQYKNLVQYDAYEGDLPHDKAREEIPQEPPTDYLYDKDRLFYSHFGLERRIKTGINTPTEIVDPANKANPIVGKRYIAANFFQRNYLEYVTEAVVLEWFKSQKQFDMPEGATGNRKIVDRNVRCVPMPEEYVESTMAIAGMANPAAKSMICSKVVFDKAKVRGELLHFLHMMAAAPCKDNDPTSRIYMELTHIMWICCKARETLVEYHPTQLHEFSGSVVVVADIHGQFPDLIRMFAGRASVEKPGWLTHNYIFLGDYVDRGTFCVETIIFLFLLKILYPKNITLLRGNHEDLMYNAGYGFRGELEERYPQCKEINSPVNCLWRLFNDVFYHLPAAAVLNDNVFLAHGGITEDLASKKSMSLSKYYSKVPMPFTLYITDTTIEKKDRKEQTSVKGTLWNDPDPDIKGFVDNDKRGSGQRFGPGPFSAFKRRHGIFMMIRGHQLTANGVRYPFNERTLIQLFSAPHYDENDDKKKKKMNNRGSTLDIALDGSMGLHIFGRLESIKTEEQAMDAFRKYHRLGKSMIGEVVEDEPTQRLVRVEVTDKNKAVEKTAEDKPSDKDKKVSDKDKKASDKDKKVEDKDKKVEDKDKKVEDKDKKVEDKDNKVDENKLLPEKTAEDKEDKVDENNLEEKTAEAPAKDIFPNVPPPSN